MSAFRRELLEQFPEFGHAPEAWGLIEAAMALSTALEKAARAGDPETGRRVLKFVLWAEAQTAREEQFIYFCQDVLRSTVSTASLRPYFVSLLNGRTFAQLAGYIEYLTSKKEVSEIAQQVGPKRREV